MVEYVENLGREHGIDAAIWMTLAVTDGETLYSVRYASDGKAPSLFYSPDADEFSKVNPEFKHLYGDEVRAVVSEPPGKYPQIWTEVPQSTLLIVRGGDLKLQPFRPLSVSRASA
jgi:glutamine amidotransferase